MTIGLEVAVAQFQQAETCASRVTGVRARAYRRQADDLRAQIVGRRVRWVTASARGTVMRVTGVTVEGLIENQRAQRPLRAASVPGGVVGWTNEDLRR